MAENVTVSARPRSSRDIAFVLVPPPGTKTKRKGSNAARIHAAKVGWQNSARAAEIAARRKATDDVQGRELINRIKPSRTPDPPTNDSAYSSDHSSSSQLSKRAPEDDVELLLDLSIPRTLSPVFGAAAFKTFDPARDKTAALIGDVMAGRIWPVIVGPATARLWFQDFCETPILFHAHSIAGPVYRDLVCNRKEPTITDHTLMHKAKAIEMVREQVQAISELSQHQLERLLFSMLILSCHELEPRHFQQLVLPFVAYLPSTNWFRLWGRIDPVHAHEQAAFALVTKLGGLRKLQMPGLALVIALLDVLRSCSYQRKPMFPCYWNAHVFDMLSIYDMELGQGFSQLFRLPPRALSVFTEVAFLDHLMAHGIDPTTNAQTLERLINIRNATVHRLVSLTAWDELEQAVCEGCDRVTYEVCRLTSIIYCNAVVFPLPPHNGWNKRLTSELLRLLEAECDDSWESNPSGLRIWSLIIGGMAAFQTPNRSYFEIQLAEVIQRKHIMFQDAMKICCEFVWSDRACKPGALSLWSKALAASVASPFEWIIGTESTEK